MSLARTSVVHVLPGRARLRMPSRRGDEPYFDGVERLMTGCPGVHSVTANSVTGSILLVYEGELDEVTRYAQQEDLFEVGQVEEEPRSRRDETPPWVTLFDEVANLDRRLRDQSDDRWGVGPLTFYGLLSACVYQISRGQVFPAATTLFLNATGILRELNRARPAPRADKT